MLAGQGDEQGLPVSCSEPVGISRALRTGLQSVMVVRNGTPVESIHFSPGDVPRREGSHKWDARRWLPFCRRESACPCTLPGDKPTLSEGVPFRVTIRL
jgi:hypothetical protein